jgi:flagellar biosynthetic protein FlhB
MAEDVERTEQPTPKRRAEAQARGQIAISHEVFVVANLLAISLALLAWGAAFLPRLAGLFRTLWAPRETLDLAGAIALLRHTLVTAATAIGPVLSVALVATLAAGLLQTRGVLSPGRLAPELSRLSPLRNLRRVFKETAPIELAKSLVKLPIAAGAMWFAIGGRLDAYFGLSRLPLAQIVGFQLGTVIEMYIAAALALVVVAAADYAWIWWRTEQALKMTKSEIKDEARQTQGDPLVRARMRSLALERARRRMMADVAKADVVVTNPDHYAVALSYVRGEMRAPKVLAKGRGWIALRVREVAREAGVPIVENPPLARALYRSVRIGQAVPEKLYQAVAQVLAYVWRLDRARARAW